jgi:peptide/nickel transport system permease protein
MLYRLIIRRLFNLAITLFLISLIIFAVTQWLPGDVAQMILGPYATEESLAVLREDMGLNEPPLTQYLNWLGGFLAGDWGESYTMHRSTRNLLIPPLLRSLQLAGVAFLGVIIVGVPLGIIVGLKQNSHFDHLISILSYGGISVPAFVVGTLLIIVFSGQLRILPGSGYVAPEENGLQWFLHLILPATSMMLMLLAYVIRMTRVGVVEVLKSKYIRTARLKGLPNQYIIRKHVVKNALMPTVTILAMNIGWLVGSVVVVEIVFAYPGIGRALVSAINTRDLPIVQAATLIIAAITCLSSLGADLIYAFINPRIRYT